MTGSVVTWLTQEAHDRLQHELDELVAHRPVIAAEINARREEGDLKENGGYHAARDEQARGQDSAPPGDPAERPGRCFAGRQRRS